MTEVGLLASVLVNFVSLYAAFRKTRTAANRADAAAEAEIGNRVIARWQAYAAEQEAARQRDAERLEGRIEELEKQLAETAAEKAACREQTARQEEKIEHLTGEVRELRGALKRAGIRPDPTN